MTSRLLYREVLNVRFLHPFGRKNLTSEILRRQLRQRQSYRPWGCCLRPGSPSSQRKIRLSAAFRLRRGDFLSRKPGFSQNKKHIARKRYVVLSFMGTSYHIICSRNKPSELSWTSHHHLLSTTINAHHLIINRSSNHKNFFWKKKKKDLGIGKVLDTFCGIIWP